MVETSIKNNLMMMYDESGYTDKYGLDLWVIITFTIIIFLACMYFYILNHLQPIKAKWAEERCNPVYMPFAGVIHDKKGDEFYTFTANNFTECTQTILKKITDYAFMPFFYAMNVISNVFIAIINSLGAMREMFDKMRNSAREITNVIFDRIFNITAPIIEMFMHVKSAVAKFVGTITTVVYTLLASYLALEAFFRVFMQLMINLLYVLIGVIVALLLLSWLPGIFPIAVGFAAAMAALLGILLVIQFSLQNILNIHPEFLPKVPALTPSCFDANTPITLSCGKTVAFSQLNISDVLQDGRTKVTGILKLNRGENKMYRMADGTLVTEFHRVFYNGEDGKSSFIYVKDHDDARLVEDYKERIVYCITTDTKIIPMGNYVYLDWDEVYDIDKPYVNPGVHGNMLVKLQDKISSKKISDVNVDDILENGEKVIGTVKMDASNIKVNGYYLRDGKHMISTPNLVISETETHIKSYKSYAEEYAECLYHLITDKGVFTCNGVEIKDFSFEM
jgi:ABC-type multidrug transport system fused ATPase/permease subunit